ncbi:MAG: hypothetical protein ACKO6N_21970 [Myxococcota bacterium]|jgi:hypothetical protein
MKQSVLRGALTLLGLLTLFVACRRIEETAGPVSSDRYAVAYISNVDGEIEPCG